MDHIKLILPEVMKDIIEKNWIKLISDKDLKAIEKAEKKLNNNQGENNYVGS